MLSQVQSIKSLTLLNLPNMPPSFTAFGSGFAWGSMHVDLGLRFDDNTVLRRPNITVGSARYLNAVGMGAAELFASNLAFQLTACAGIVALHKASLLVLHKVVGAMPALAFPKFELAWFLATYEGTVLGATMVVKELAELRLTKSLAVPLGIVAGLVYLALLVLSVCLMLIMRQRILRLEQGGSIITPRRLAVRRVGRARHNLSSRGVFHHTGFSKWRRTTKEVSLAQEALASPPPSPPPPAQPETSARNVSDIVIEEGLGMPLDERLLLDEHLLPSRRCYWLVEWVKSPEWVWYMSNTKSKEGTAEASAFLYGYGELFKYKGGLARCANAAIPNYLFFLVEMAHTVLKSIILVIITDAGTQSALIVCIECISFLLFVMQRPFADTAC